MPTSNTNLTEISGRLPRHVQVSEALARDIQAGHLQDGVRLAPEREMAERFGISVGTLRKALADLSEKGLLRRVQGSGNYVQHNSMEQTIYGFFRLELLAGGGLPTAEVLSIERLKKPNECPQIGSTKDAFRIRRGRQLNGLNAALEEIWLDGSFAESLDAKHVNESLYQYYRDSLNLWITRVEDVIHVASIPDWRPSKFLGKASSCGYVERLSFDQNNKPAEYSRTWFDPEIARYVARWK